MSARRTTRHETVDHTSEITLRVYAPTFPEVLAEATRAFGELVPIELLTDLVDEWRDFDLEASDPAASLVAWLNEIVYLCEVEQWLPVEVDAAPTRDDGLRIRARGVALAVPFVAVKAATLHGASVHEGGDGLVVEVTLDV